MTPEFPLLKTRRRSEVLLKILPVWFERCYGVGRKGNEGHAK
jgi:hypothetical protein